MSLNNSYPTVATIIGCPETLTSANGLVATPIGVSGAMLDDPSLVKDPIKRAVLDNICGNLPTTKPREQFMCDVCDVTCNAEISYKVHLEGSKHAKKLKDKVLADTNLRQPFIVEDPRSKTYRCTLCNVLMNANSQITAHINGLKHKYKTQVNAAVVACNAKINSDSIKKHVDATPNLLYCAACDIKVNSTVQFQQHTDSKRHINKVNGRSNPRVSPYHIRSKVDRNIMKNYFSPGTSAK